MTTLLYWKDNEQLQTLWSEFEQYKKSMFEQYGVGPLPMKKWMLGVPMGYFAFLRHHHNRIHVPGGSYTNSRWIYYPETWTVEEENWYVRSLTYEQGFRLYINLSSDKEQQLPDFAHDELSIAEEFTEVNGKAFPALWLPAVHLTAYQTMGNGLNVIRHRATFPDNVRSWAPPDWVRERNVFLEKVTFGYDFGTGRSFIQLWHKLVNKHSEVEHLCTVLTNQAFDTMNRAIDMMSSSFGKLAIKKSQKS